DPAARSVPIVLTSAGLNGSFFTSELTIANRGNNPVTVDYTYTAAFGGGSGTTSDFLPPGQQKIVPDAIAYLQTLGLPISSSGNRGGTLTAKFNNLSAPDGGVLSVRTTTAVSGGRAGLAYPGTTTASLLRGSAYLCGLRQNGEDRSNVAFVNAGDAADGPITLRPTVFSGDSTASQTLDDVTLAPGQFTQLTEVLAPLGISNGFVRVDKVSGKAPYQTYAVINDQANSDGSFIPAVPIDALVGVKSLTLPVVVESSAFSTEVILTNWSSSAKTVALKYVADAIQSAGNAATVSVDVPPGRQIVLPSFVQYLRSRGAPGVVAPGPTFAGGLFVTLTTGDAGGLSIGARTASPGGGGKYGLFYVALPNGRGVANTVWLYGLQQNAENRSNLALVNSGDYDDLPITFKVEVFDGATGAIVGTMSDVILGAKRWYQIGNVLTASGAGTTSGYVRVTRVAGQNSFVAYGVVNDGGAPGQRTGDGAFISANTVFGRVLSRLTMRLSDTTRAGFQNSPQALAAAGATLTPAGLQFPAGVPLGYRVYAGNQTATIDEDGYFIFEGVPAGTLAEVRDASGSVRQTFPVAQLLASEGQLPEPILISRLWDGPLYMTEGDSGSADYPPDSSVAAGCCASSSPFSTGTTSP
ncbi:MAG TPA: hypothetical protein VGR00_14920, partial [Thermoanaerobaculia bacterium]|nr:hypothetical protein [Thermoanaerobaculia bacterium]